MIELLEKRLDRRPSGLAEHEEKILLEMGLARWYRGRLIPVMKGGMPNPYTSPTMVDIADGTQVAASTAETIICPDYTFVPGGTSQLLYPGAGFNIKCYFDVSNVVTAPGTVTFRVRWGGVAGTVLAASAAITMSSTARANFTGSLDCDLIWRTTGAAGSCFAMGEVHLNNVPTAADSAPQGIYTMTSAGANVPAVVSSLDTTTSKALSVTVQFSVNTAGTQITNHLRRLLAISS